jgi:hypothetical protein
MGRTDGADQRIAGLFLQGFALHGADGQTKGDVFSDQGAVRPLADGEKGFSHSRRLRALLAGAIGHTILEAKARLAVSSALPAEVTIPVCGALSAGNSQQPLTPRAAAGH